jgi:hypothetical protein
MEEELFRELFDDWDFCEAYAAFVCTPEEIEIKLMMCKGMVKLTRWLEQQ